MSLELVLLISVVSLVGCRSIIGEPASTQVRSMALCVEQHLKDERDLARQIAESLEASGVSAISATAGDCPRSQPHRVVYQDNWNWDMRMYLAKLTIEILDNQTNEILAYGEASQTTLGALGMSHRDVIDRAVSALLGRLE